MLVKERRGFALRIYIGILMVLAVIMRIIACYWGAPQELNIDEQFIIYPALNLIRDKTYICHLVNRPDQVEIKCVALILSIASRILWHADPNAVFDNHSVAIYLIGRFFISCWGVAMVPVSAVLAGRIAAAFKFRKEPAQISA